MITLTLFALMAVIVAVALLWPYRPMMLRADSTTVVRGRACPRCGSTLVTREGIEWCSGINRDPPDPCGYREPLGGLMWPDTAGPLAAQASGKTRASTAEHASPSSRCSRV